MKQKRKFEDIFFYWDTRKERYGAIVSVEGEPEPIILDGRKE